MSVTESMTHAAPAVEPGAPARIGPNAIIREVEALEAFFGRVVRDRILARAALAHYAGALPEAMVAEGEVARLHEAVVAEIRLGAAVSVAREAGRRTGEYLLANRIPAPARVVLRWLPAPLAARALVAAIRRHGWTFCGSARFEARARARGVDVVIAGGIVGAATTAAPAIHAYYAATFEHLFRALVARGAWARVDEAAPRDRLALTLAW